MKRVMSGVLAAALMVPALTACGGNNFCDAAPDDINMDDPGAVKTALEDVVDEAPDEIKDDIEVLIEQLGLVESDPASIDVAAVTEASDALVAWEEENC